jgi:REP element-mobilizing transposase RayT
MPYDPQLHRRRSIRLRGYDYSQGEMYFVTICTQDRAPFFEDEAVRQLAERCWLALSEHFASVELDEWIVMPNHVHRLVLISDVGGGGEQGAGQPPQWVVNAPTDRAFPEVSPRRNSLGVIVRTYKAAVTTACRQAGFHGFAWQRGYHDRVVRNDRELDNIRRYIFNNPYHWENDEHYLATPADRSQPGERRSPP